jgi:hypothetical protein
MKNSSDTIGNRSRDLHPPVCTWVISPEVKWPGWEIDHPYLMPWLNSGVVPPYVHGVQWGSLFIPSNFVAIHERQSYICFDTSCNNRPLIMIEVLSRNLNSHADISVSFGAITRKINLIFI